MELCPGVERCAAIALQLRSCRMEPAMAGPLRSALDYLRDCVAELFESKAGAMLHDPGRPHDYIDVVLDRSPDSLWLFFEKHSSHQLSLPKP